jgi:hypothetical protein
VKFDIDGGAFIFKTGLFERERVSVSQIKVVGKVEHHDAPEPPWVGVLKGIGGIVFTILAAIVSFISHAGFVAGSVIGAILIWHGSVMKGIGVLFLGGASQLFLPIVFMFFLAIITGFLSPFLGYFSDKYGTKFICGFNDGRGFYGKTDPITYTVIRALSPQSSASSGES